MNSITSSVTAEHWLEPNVSIKVETRTNEYWGPIVCVSLGRSGEQSRLRMHRADAERLAMAIANALAQEPVA